MKQQSSTGIGFFGLLTIVFVTLKLAEIGVVASWSWVWVLGPLWIPLGIALVAVAIAALIGVIRKAWSRK